MVPNARIVAMIINPNYPPHAADAVEVQSAAQSIGRQLLVLRAGSPQAIDLAFATLVEQRAGALLVGGDPFLVGRSQQLVAMAARHAIPAIYDFRESVLLGGLMSYGSNLPNNYRQLGVYAGRILKGESAADLPVMHPALFDFTINFVTANANTRPQPKITRPLVLIFRLDLAAAIGGIAPTDRRRARAEVRPIDGDRSAVWVPDPRPAQLIQPGAAAAVNRFPSPTIGQSWTSSRREATALKEVVADLRKPFRGA